MLKLILVPVILWIIIFAICSLYVEWDKPGLKEMALVASKIVFVTTMTVIVITLIVQLF